MEPDQRRPSSAGDAPLTLKAGNLIPQNVFLTLPLFIATDSPGWATLHKYFTQLLYTTALHN
jgi:hypothetical protein